MLFKIDPRILNDFPGVTIGIISAQNIDNTTKKKKVADLLERAQEDVAASIKREDIKEHPHIAPWREAYKKFGGEPKKNLPSVENLITRVVKKVPFGSVNTLVDLYNIISLKYMLPAGAEDLDTIKGNIELTYASKNEQPILLLGEKEARAPREGEAIYKDDNGTICRRWNWKEADRTKLTSQTHNAFFVLEGLPPVNKEYVTQATYALANLIEKFCGGEVSVAILDQNNASIELKSNNKFIPLLPFQRVDIDEKPHIYTQEEQQKAHAASQEHQVRKEKVEKLKELGIPAWPEAELVNSEAKNVFDEFEKQQNKKIYELAGRILAIREHGKTIFATFQDSSDQLQIYLKKDDIGEEKFQFFRKYIDIGDIVWIKGSSFRTNMGEITLEVQDFKLLSKCLHPLPERFHGLRDIETRYRQRYLDLITNAESRERFKKRAKIIHIIREFLNEHHFIEVETPLLQPIPGGAAAKPFITHHNALSSDFYLRIAPELYLKRLVVGGFERVFEIGRNFRNEGISTKHNPEFTMFEMYVAHHNYEWMMDFSEELLKKIVSEVCDSPKVTFGEYTIDFSKQFERISMHDAIVKYAGIPAKDLTPKTIDVTIKTHKISMDPKKKAYGDKLFELFDQLVEHKLIQPTFITHFPIEVSPLAKRDPENLDFVLRFEMFVAGMELSNAFNELNDPFDQAERFKQQVSAKDAGDEEAHHYDADYILALEHALPPTVGFGMGIDRLTMLLTNTTSIKDVILFPTLKKR